MSGVLESLSNPLSALAENPRSVQLAANTQDGDTVWDVAQQYYANDAVFSSVNGGLYIYAPSSTDPTTTIGGVDPGANGAAAGWKSTTSVGVSPGGWVAPASAPTFTPGAAGVALTVTNGVLSDIPEDSRWLSLFTCTVANASAWVAADNVAFTFTGNGTGGTADTTTCYGGVGGPASVSFCGHCVIKVGTGGSTITLTAPTAGSAGVLQPSNANWTLIRLD